MVRVTFLSPQPLSWIREDGVMGGRLAMQASAITFPSEAFIQGGRGMLA